MVNKEQQILIFREKLDYIFLNSFIGSNDFKVLLFLLKNHDDCFTQAEIIKENKGWVSSSVSRSVRKLLAFNLLQQIVVGTTMKYSINLDWDYNTFIENNI